mgnify:CR=1 FL=1
MGERAGLLTVGGLLAAEEPWTSRLILPEKTPKDQARESEQGVECVHFRPRQALTRRRSAVPAHHLRASAAPSPSLLQWIAPLQPHR